MPASGSDDFGHGEATPEPSIATVGGGGGSGGGFTTSANPSAGGESGVPRERLPGMGPIWQAPDMSWRTLELGPPGRSPKPLWPPEEDGSSRGAGASAGEDHDPRPPEQDPEQGRL